MRRFGIAALLLLTVVPAMCRMAAAKGKDHSDQDLSHRNLSNQDLEGDIFENADLKGTNLTGARAAGANFCGADLSEARLEGTKLNGADFRKAKLDWLRTSSDTDLSGANLEKLDFTAKGMYEQTKAE